MDQKVGVQTGLTGRRALALLALSLPAAVLAASAPGVRSGSAFEVSGASAGFQSSHKIASDGAGNFVTVWEDNAADTGNTWQIHARCFDASGVARGAAFRVDPGGQIGRFPAVAMNAAGTFVVVWEKYSSAVDTGHTIQAQRYNSSCAAQGGAISVSNNNNPRSPAVAIDDSGNFILAWLESYVVKAARYTAAGAQMPASVISVDNTAAPMRQYAPSIAADGAGDFVVAWAVDTGLGDANAGLGDDTDVMAQAYTSSNAALIPIGSKVAVNQTTTEVQDAPAVAITPTGGKVIVAWESYGQVTSTAQQIYARTYTLSVGGSTFSASSGEFRVNPSSTGFTWAPQLSADVAGNFWTAWQDGDGSGNGQGGFARWFNAGSSTFDSAINLNAPAANSQVLPSVSGDASGDLLTAWSDQGANGVTINEDVIASRFSGHTSADLGLSKQVSNASPNPGTALNYTLSVSNANSAVTPTGNSWIDAYVGSSSTIAITDPLPSGVSYVGFDNTADTAWTCANASGTVTCKYAAVLPPQGNTQVILNVNSPGAAGSFSNTATLSELQYDANNTNDSGTANSVVPLAYSPSSLNFGNQALGVTSSPQTVTITNGSGAAVSISTISVSPVQYQQTNNCGTTLANGASCTINVTFTPAAPGSKPGSLSFISSGTSSPYKLFVGGTGIAPGLTFNPKPYAFGNQAVGSSSAPTAVTVTNSGTAALSISNIALSGDYSQTNNCSAPISPGSTCTINVTFSPTKTGNRAGALTVTSNSYNSPNTDTFSGNGTGSIATFTPKPLAFGTQAVNSNTQLTATLTNTGNATMNITSFSVTGDYAQTGTTCGSTLAAGANCTVDVTFTPVAVGLRKGSLSVVSDAFSAPPDALSGTGQ